MIPVGQPYVPAGALDARSVLITTILGTTAAVIAAALVWVWEWSPIPTLLILTPLLQGLAVGAGHGLCHRPASDAQSSAGRGGRVRLRITQRRTGALWPLPPHGLLGGQRGAEPGLSGQDDSRRPATGSLDPSSIPTRAALSTR